ncbi:MAG: hypothetical protein RIQ60_365 [Pseudomonadota bacterium]|jgi:hypothetical protein
MALMPGSNPMFGLNTLGGAWSVQTKDGHTAPDGNIALTLGSRGRRQLTLEGAGSKEQGLDWYGAANLFKERGWRNGSPSDTRQLFDKLG